METEEEGARGGRTGGERRTERVGQQGRAGKGV